MNKAVVLMYHNIGNPPGGRDPLGLYVPSAMFRFQMWYLKTAGFEVVPLENIIDLIHGQPCRKRMVALTFDDGYLDFYENAYPVLHEYNFPSTVFLVSDHIGGHNVWDKDSSIEKRRLLDWDTICSLRKKGITFGSHSRTHPFLSRLTPEGLRAELSGSKSDIETHLQFPVDFFCYPYGDYNSRTAEAVKEAGYKLAVTTKRGLVRKGDDPFQVRRSFVRAHTNPFLFLLRLHSGYEDRKRGN